MNSQLLFAYMILAIISFGLQGILLTAVNNAYAEWMIPSQLNEAYKNINNNSTATSIEGTK